MQSTISFILLLVLFKISSPRHLDAENNTQLESAKFSTDVSSLEEALTALNELTQAQKRVREQQESHTEQMQTRFTQFAEKEQQRSKALEAEQNTLKEIRDKISRKLKVLAKGGIKNKTYERSNCYGSSTTDIPPKDCAAIYLDGDDSSGKYKIWPTWDQNKSFPVFCDMDTDGGGWTVIHRWLNSGIPEDYFRRSLTDYKMGFGDLANSFWLGTEKMHQLTNQGSYELRFDFQKEGGKKTSSVYRRFRVDPRNQNYVVHVEDYEPSGTAGDVFSSSDDRNFASESDQCRSTYSNRSYWWFSSNCQEHSNLNISSSDSSSSLEMKIRPVQFIRMKEAE